ncbi:acetyltransferase [Flammeovirgaceae bacterium 311]|nr:acetyltransferase [Flammeovirgaceae bacterium 311]
MIRPYTTGDKQELISLLKLNIPQYFAESEEDDFIEYLDCYLEDYFVVEEGGKLIGSGGINYFPEDGIAPISWDMIHPAYQGKGFGKSLTLHRISNIRKNPAIRRVVVRTTQLAYKFYEKVGFTLLKTEKDFWAEGFDLYQMTLDLEHSNAGKD